MLWNLVSYHPENMPIKYLITEETTTFAIVLVKLYQCLIAILNEEAEMRQKATFHLNRHY